MLRGETAPAIALEKIRISSNPFHVDREEISETLVVLVYSSVIAAGGRGNPKTKG
jgi:hypothetical protein